LFETGAQIYLVQSVFSTYHSYGTLSFSGKQYN
jgi:hypothetical protein